jgi:UDP-N-acetylglucosamine diphosphorylase / glucose-1-phosphate thymidylyltransferase / UDP-N-acetylgalactosamine diphosphorylase / glucosamine-1-phosphate N-acetyltransferase / galactosamine-1-phosphate N-acetyltransferase
MKIIIPMAGLGTRFAKVSHLNPEYKKPKPFIIVKGRPMVRWATASLPFFVHLDEQKKEEAEPKVGAKDLIFIILKAHDDEHQMEKELRHIYSDNIRVIILDAVTRGAAETAYQAKEYVDADEELIISDSDHYFDGTYLEETIANKHPDTVGIIPCFRDHDGIPKWSFSLLDGKSNVIVKVAEKDPELMRMGAHANIGSYYFSKARHFFDEAHEVINNNTRFGEAGKGEFYIAPLYQRLIEKNQRVEAAVTPQIWNIGTPEDLEHFLAHFTEEN